MAKEEFVRKKPHVNVGVIGHTGHGKTTLIAAILRVQSGLGLANCYNSDIKVTVTTEDVECESSKRHYALIDCPGLPEYTKNMFKGASQMDGVILVVDACSSVQPQTVQHLILARQAGVNHLVVFLNRCDDLVFEGTGELIDLTMEEIRKFLSKYDFYGNNVPIIPGSALKVFEGGSSNYEWASKIEELLNALDNVIPTTSMSEMDKPFLMEVADVFSVKPVGTIVKGRIARGTVKVGDEVELVGINDTKRTIVTGLEMFGKILDQGIAGDIVTCQLRNVASEDISIGQVLAKPSSITPHIKFQAEIYVLTEEEGGRHTPFFTNDKQQFFIGTADVEGTITLPEGVNTVMPGEIMSMGVELITPIYMEKQMSFAVHDGNSTIGTGVITDILR